MGDYVTLDRHFSDELTAEKLSAYDGPVGEFSRKALSADVLLRSGRRFNCEKWLAALNELQTIAAAFVTGVADEQTGFEMIGRSFCNTVRRKYDILCIARGDPAHGYYQSIVTLYHVWQPRLTKAELNAASKDLDQKINSIPDVSIPPIGSDRS